MIIVYLRHKETVDDYIVGLLKDQLPQFIAEALFVKGDPESEIRGVDVEVQVFNQLAQHKNDFTILIFGDNHPQEMSCLLSRMDQITAEVESLLIIESPRPVKGYIYFHSADGVFQEINV